MFRKVFGENQETVWRGASDVILAEKARQGFPKRICGNPEKVCSEGAKSVRMHMKYAYLGAPDQIIGRLRLQLCDNVRIVCTPS